MTELDLDALEAAEAKMTPGVWNESANKAVTADGRIVSVCHAMSDLGGGGSALNNAAGIVALRNNAAELIRLARLGLDYERRMM